MRCRHMHFQKIPRSKKNIHFWSHPVCQGVFWDAESRGHHLMLTCQAVSFSVLQRFWFFRLTFTWNSKQPVLYGCFNWMIQNLYMGNGCFTKHPFINGWPWSSRYIYIYSRYISKYISNGSKPKGSQVWYLLWFPATSSPVLHIHVCTVQANVKVYEISCVFRRKDGTFNYRK